ncbi:hypothetical protein [Staphylococcus phage SA3]|uniref:Uncharacterized protein n=9 Tax=Kayvirus TaxID=1857843 RepID=A0A3Q9R5K1_9CAUD|nr:hypothetical protein F360_gp052 [Staphylococcus phage G15]YP_009099507.1 hypothetical protein P108_0170 [Staphylococcus phage P108]ARQ96023.1 hypothetical protein qdsa002_66 [Staphylococcus phage qdsa002]ASZ78195.1 hypothetical protein [Staphylococcus phage SA3]AUG85700.1 hypothetical protein HSA30_gp196 [Staphylococcus phage HSA30]AXU40220.1 hypothetical protein VBSavMJYL01_218 [Staphylococcus phage VB_SavM_JYL01]AZU97626.1 hypothetical protein VBSavMJYL02_214 [Staphylococcus phage VB-Sav
MVKPVITLEVEETKLLLDYLSFLEDDMRNYEGMRELYEELHKKYQLAKGNYSD